MKKLTQIVIGVFTLFFIVSCGGGKKDQAALVKDKKAAIEKLKADRTKTDMEIKKLEAELEVQAIMLLTFSPTKH